MERSECVLFNSCGICNTGLKYCPDNPESSFSCLDFAIELINEGFNINKLTLEFRSAVMKRSFQRATERS